MASLLAEHRVPVAVLNACQSAMQAGSEAEPGPAAGRGRGAGRGRDGVLGDGDGGGAGDAGAVRADRRRGRPGRRGARGPPQTCTTTPARQAYFEQQLDLEDWMLPVMFAQQPLQLRLRPMDDAEQAAVLRAAGGGRR